jgi:hypothetical protein
MRRSGAWIATLIGVVTNGCLTAASPQAWSNDKGVNYLTGGGNPDVQAAYSNVDLVEKDIAVIAKLGVQWVRLETPKLAPPANPNGVLAVLQKQKLLPLINVLAWSYDPATERARYQAWVKSLVETTTLGAIEFGDEPNLDVRTESFPGASLDDYPMGGTYAMANSAPTVRLAPARVVRGPITGLPSDHTSPFCAIHTTR